MPKNFQTSQYDEPIAFDGWTEVEVDGGDVPHRDRARPHGGGHRQVAARRRRDRPHPRRRLLAGRLQPRRHPADRDRHQADHGCRARRRRRWRGRTSRSCATCCSALGVSDVRMEQGSLRCDVNLSLAPAGADGARHPHRDQERQLAALGRAGGALRDRAATRRSSTAGGSIVQETRHWHEDTGVTTSGREKSDAEDYRYFPEPDLVPVAPSREWVEELRGDAARAAARAPRAAAGRVGLLRPRDARHRRCRRARPGRGDHRRRRRPAGRPQVVALRAGPPGQRAGRRARRAADHARRRSPRIQALVDDGLDQRQAGPAGVRRRARRRGLAGRGRRGPRPRGRLRRGRARRRPSTGPSRPTPTWPTRSATARSPPPAPSSAR